MLLIVSLIEVLCIICYLHMETVCMIWRYVTELRHCVLHDVFCMWKWCYLPETLRTIWYHLLDLSYHVWRAWCHLRCYRMSYDESYRQLKQWLDEVSKESGSEMPLRGTLSEKREHLSHYQVSPALTPPPELQSRIKYLSMLNVGRMINVYKFVLLLLVFRCYYFLLLVNCASRGPR